VQPYIALALGLMEKGHEVTLLANENFREFVEGYGVGFFPLYGNIEAMVHSPELVAVLKSGNAIAYLRQMRNMMQKIQSQVNVDMMQGAANADVLIAGPLTMAWVYSIAEKLDKKWAVVQLSVPAIPTKEFPFAGFAFFNAPWYNLFTYKLVRSIYWRINKKDINQYRVSLGLPLLMQSILKNIDDQKILQLYAISPSLIARPEDWDATIDITGFLTITGGKRKSQVTDQAPEGLVEWLKQGEAPIYIGFGSIPIPNPGLFADILVDMLTNTNHRFIFCMGWSDLPDLPTHSRLFVIKYVDHEWLFPQCKTVITHGGIGTIAAALKAKIPPVIVSIFADQPLWGKIIADKNLGIHLPFKKLTKKKLLHAIATTQTFKIKQNASIIGERISSEDGLQSAINALENYFK
jgi:UDP:flavonoid glycosyltransferase YjiC (YdhE family)